MLDIANHVLVPLAGRPQTTDWPSIVHNATARMNAVCLSGVKLGMFTAGDKAHRCSHLIPVTCGVPYGGGQRVSQFFYLTHLLILNHVDW